MTTSTARDTLVWVKSRLQGEWNAPQLASQLSVEKLGHLVEEFDSIDPMIKVRLLVACLFLSKGHRLEYGDLLKSLSVKARADSDEWVRTVARAAGGFAGQLNLDAVLEGSAMVRRDPAAAGGRIPGDCICSRAVLLPPGSCPLLECCASHSESRAFLRCAHRRCAESLCCRSVPPLLARQLPGQGEPGSYAAAAAANRARPAKRAFTPRGVALLRSLRLCSYALASCLAQLGYLACCSIPHLLSTCLQCDACLYRSAALCGYHQTRTHTACRD